ncbi:hypothetical protein MP478_04340 [Chryseobacterium sp. WG14]|uniref:hypothetical protein n=1 Tax=Chryseobacterium sp. WG14 TaxID=2926909 RepID=UPI00211DF35D|nr:hypothetical protein [Chryseobacterium sp. WG14]MCQ9638609.1 hypothetical protein [Chryseobacterium sp. WG14]
MIVELWYEGNALDMYENTDIKHTLQINDVAEVKDRQASYTNSFKIPKTPKNVLVFGGLGIHSSSSIVPYIKPNALLKIDGFDFLTQAWLQVKSTDEEYDVSIYSGIIEFFKKFENKTIGEELATELTEINHNKNLDTVIATQNDDSLKYAYLFADFNGRTHRISNSNVVNIDFIVPSVPISYLFDKIHLKYGYTYEGSFLTLDDFTNLHISYPKAPEDDGSVIYFQDTKNIGFSSPGNEDSLGFTFNNSGINGIKILEKSIYNLKTIGISGLNEPIPSGLGVLNYQFYYKINNNTPVVISNNWNGVLELEINDVIDFWYEVQTDWNGTISMSITIKKLENVSFTDEFSDLKITELLKDVYNFFGLTPIVDNVNRNIKYILNKERFKEADVDDWTKYLLSIDNETYKFGSYEKNNLFRYKYNDQEETHSDSAIIIDNKNLDDEKTVFTSFTYSVEKERLSDFYVNGSLVQKVSIYKLYEKEPQDGSTELKYKPLSKRYFYLRMKKISTSVVIGSDIQDVEITNSAIKFGEFRDLTMEYILGKYYADFKNVINQSVIWNVSLNIPYPKLIKLDLTKVLYFKQLQQYCFINKISFDEKKTTAELVRIKDFTK